MLSDFQKRLALLITSLREAESFALAGGAALIVHGRVDRSTRDLDFFARDADAVDRLVPAVESACGAAGFDVERGQVAHGFARLLIRSGVDECLVDFGYDFRLRPPVETDIGRVLAVDELAADKVLALVGRAEARDFVDVAALTQQIPLERMCDLAEAKDPGFRRAALAARLEAIDRLDRRDFELDDEAFSLLRRAVKRWHAELSGG